MSSHKISIVMPCYNCVKTLEEALASVYLQDFKIPYEVIMIDDGSTDNTKELIISLAKKYANVRYFFHDKNLGGGAARNTGVAKSSGDLIFCLDSDNILTPNSLMVMIDYLDQHQADGVGFFERRYFSGNDHKAGIFSSQFNKIIDRSLSIDDFFNDNEILLDNFLYSVDSFNQTSGYSTAHGFDTQSFEIKYLSRNFNILICPEAIFYHRQALKNKSYFERVYERGEMSRNWYIILEDIFYLFSREIQEKIIKFDVFKNASLGNNLMSMLKSLYKNNPSIFFSSNYKSYLSKDGFSKYFSEIQGNTEVADLFCAAIYFRINKMYWESMNIFVKILGGGWKFPLVYYNLFKISLLQSGITKDSEVDSFLCNIVGELSLQTQKPIMIRGLVNKIINKLRIIKNKIIKK